MYKAKKVHTSLINLCFLLSSLQSLYSDSQMLCQTCEKKKKRYVGINGTTWQNVLLLTLSELYPNAAGKEGIWRS